jgi:hypothetical protein
MLTYFDMPEEYGDFQKSELESLLQGVEGVLQILATAASGPNGVSVKKLDSLEISIGFLGSFFGILNLHTMVDMVQVLLASVKGAPVSGLSAEETSKEFTPILIRLLTVDFLGKKSGNFVFTTLQSAAPRNQADLQKIAGAHVAVKSASVEVRFLIESSRAKNQTGKLTKKV